MLQCVPMAAPRATKSLNSRQPVALIRLIRKEAMIQQCSSADLIRRALASYLQCRGHSIPQAVRDFPSRKPSPVRKRRKDISE